MKFVALPWLILFLPLLAAGIITLFTLRDRKTSATLSIGAIVTGFVLTLVFSSQSNGWDTRAKPAVTLAVHRRACTWTSA